MWLFIKNLIFTLVVPGSVGGYLPLWIAAASGRTLAGPWTARQALGWVPIALGAGIYLWCMWDFATFGRGTPAPIDAPKRLVVRGPYRYVRNPMYVGVLTVITGWCVFFGFDVLGLYLVAVASGCHLFVLLYEEPTLRRLFGDDYASYCRSVRRWLPRRPSPRQT